MNHVIIKIESGVVSDVYFTEPVKVTFVNHDVIEGRNPYDTRMKSAVISMTVRQHISPEDIELVVKKLVLECEQPESKTFILSPLLAT
jgi:hypothetical protein